MKRMLMTEREMHILYDLQYMMTDGCWDTISLNDPDKVVETFFKRLERRVVPELHEEENG